MNNKEVNNMKKILCSIVALCCTIVAGAQNEMVTAVLQHGDSETVYKGGTAFQQAYAAAVDNDVITLSSGTFKRLSSSIEKVLAIYGAGFEDDAATSTAITAIDGDLYVGKADATLDGIHIEGLCVRGNLNAANNTSSSTTAELKNFTLQKCYITGNLHFNSNIETVTVKQCEIGSGIYGTNNNTASGLTIANCYVWERIAGFSIDSRVHIDHCLTCRRYTSGRYSSDTYYFSQFLWTNSILGNRSAYDGWGDNTIGEYSTVKNCIVIGSSFNNTVISENCYINIALADVFNDGTDLNYSEDRTWKLKDENTYVGTDGTPIGPYGGDGWNKVPATPVVKNLNATVNGANLGVSYEAIAR